ncbi:hypothetical protein PG999_009112 [Apiospora kogelbergensis]|uniref:Uncharacterized protein n=1 Tax=Apiospora kogelbergensis TaxID=1337665 RepID=A0AAW0QKE0_9PEZI
MQTQHDNGRLLPGYTGMQIPQIDEPVHESFLPLARVKELEEPLINVFPEGVSDGTHDGNLHEVQPRIQLHPLEKRKRLVRVRSTEGKRDPPPQTSQPQRPVHGPDGEDGNGDPVHAGPRDALTNCARRGGHDVGLERPAAGHEGGGDDGVDDGPHERPA